MTWSRIGLGAVLVMSIGCGDPAPAPVPPKPPETTATTPQSTPAVPGNPAPANASPAVTNTNPPATQPETPVAEPPFELEEGFSLLTLSDFEAFGAEADTWSATADGLACTGKPRGYLYSKQSYGDFTLRLEYQFPRPASLKDDTKFKGNTGFLVYVTGEHKLWPVCLEVQGKHVQMGAIKENGGAQPVTATDDEAARQQARRPVGKWNTLEINSRSGALIVSLNHMPVSKCEPNFLSDGPIGIQSEDHPFEVRRMRIRREQPSP